MTTNRFGFNLDFSKMMQNRMMFGFYRYGLSQNAEQHDAIKRLRAKLREYNQTGNTELLVDVANYAMMEFTNPEHEEAHFTSNDQGLLNKSRVKPFR